MFYKKVHESSLIKEVKTIIKLIPKSIDLGLAKFTVRPNSGILLGTKILESSLLK